MYLLKFIFLIGEPSFQCNSITKKRELTIIKNKRKPSLSLVNKFNSLKHNQHFNTH